MKNYEKELVVIKVGSSTLEKQNHPSGTSLCEESFLRIAHQSEDLVKAGTNVAIVSSGAVSAGYAYSGEVRTENTSTLEKQRYACLGQTALMHAWQSAFNYKAAQLLFTKHELETDEGVELLALSEFLLQKENVIIANENDALSHQGISFGDNDTLSAHYAALLHNTGRFNKTSLIILSDVHGVYEDKDDASTLISEVRDLRSMRHIAGDSASLCGTGGMKSKFQAAEIAGRNGIDTYITHGRTDNSIIEALQGRTGTRFTYR